MKYTQLLITAVTNSLAP